MPRRPAARTVFAMRSRMEVRVVMVLLDWFPSMRYTDVVPDRPEKELRAPCELLERCPRASRRRTPSGCRSFHECALAFDEPSDARVGITERGHSPQRDPRSW